VPKGRHLRGCALRLSASESSDSFDGVPSDSSGGLRDTERDLVSARLSSSSDGELGCGESVRALSSGVSATRAPLAFAARTGRIATSGAAELVSLACLSVSRKACALRAVARCTAPWHGLHAT